VAKPLLACFDNDTLICRMVQKSASSASAAATAGESKQQRTPLSLCRPCPNTPTPPLSASRWTMRRSQMMCWAAVQLCKARQGQRHPVHTGCLVLVAAPPCMRQWPREACAAGPLPWHHECPIKWVREPRLNKFKVEDDGRMREQHGKRTSGRCDES
jgi:hypothetical protein